MINVKFLHSQDILVLNLVCHIQGFFTIFTTRTGIQRQSPPNCAKGTCPRHPYTHTHTKFSTVVNFFLFYFFYFLKVPSICRLVKTNPSISYAKLFRHNECAAAGRPRLDGNSRQVAGGALVTTCNGVAVLQSQRSGGLCHRCGHEAALWTRGPTTRCCNRSGKSRAGWRPFYIGHSLRLVLSPLTSFSRSLFFSVQSTHHPACSHLSKRNTHCDNESEPTQTRSAPLPPAALIPTSSMVVMRRAATWISPAREPSHISRPAHKI